MYQAYAHTCKILTHISFFFLHLHAIFGSFCLHSLVNVYLSCTVLLYLYLPVLFLLCYWMIAVHFAASMTSY